MADTIQGTPSPFIEVEYTDKIVFTPHNGREAPDTSTIWQQSQGQWQRHPVFQGLAIHEIMT